MSRELLIRSTIWLSTVAYTVGCIVLATGRPLRWVRLAWTIGCVALLAHYIVAFHFFHSWSHAAAYADTARQTAEVFRINWGGGLFVNYGVAALWIADIVWWWFAGLNAYLQRRWWLTLLGHAFFIFILFNAMVVFKDGWIRWVGLLICLSLCFCWFTISRQRNEFSQQ